MESQMSDKMDNMDTEIRVNRYIQDEMKTDLSK